MACEPGAEVAPLLARLRAAGVEPPAVELLDAAEPAAIEALLCERLAVARVGVRLHLVGSDAFVRRMTVAAAGSGLLPDEVGLSADAAPAAYRVACVHCRTVTEPVAENVVPCAGCGRMLFVYHHYSRRKAAYMGFQADAEVHDELPEPKAGLPCP